jgi:hypothetical protein
MKGAAKEISSTTYPQPTRIHACRKEWAGRIVFTIPVLKQNELKCFWEFNQLCINNMTTW